MKILRHIFVLIVMAAFGASVTYAYFSSQAKVKGAMFSTGTANLQLSQSESGPWSQELTGMNFSGIIPGWSNDYHLFIKNAGTTTLKLKLSGGLTGTDSCGLISEINLSLSPWFNNTLANLSSLGADGIALDQIDAGQIKPLTLNFSMNSTKEKNETACNLTGYDFMFNGVAEPTIQPTPTP